MPVPKEILAVERPKNTVVVMYGKTKNLFAVRERVGCSYDHGRRIPINGKTVGHIIDGKYVSKDAVPTPVSQSQIDLKDWGTVVLCDRLASSLLNELTAVYDKNDALKIYCTAILRVCRPGIKDYELKGAYEESFLSEIYPDVALSKNTVSKFWNDLGKAYSRICKYMGLRMAAVENSHHIIIDGTLKSNESTVNSLSDYSRKAKVRGTRDISVLYAYDLEAGEPLCSKCFPGDLNYMNPLKRDSRHIEQCDLLQYGGQLPEHETVLYKKAKAKGEEKWLYSFRDTAQAHKEDYGWLHKAQKNGEFCNNQYMEDWLLFGTIILESDLDMEPSVAYKTYDCRWEIELVMRYYKQTCEFDETRVHDDYSVIGSEFCNFLSTVITYRMLNAFEKADLFKFKKMTYKKILSILTRAKKVRIDGADWALITMNPSQIEILQALDLLPKPTPKKRGRKPKNKV
jgi:hypothetical protein